MYSRAITLGSGFARLAIGKNNNPKASWRACGYIVYKHSSGTIYVVFRDVGQILKIRDCPGDSGTMLCTESCPVSQKTLFRHPIPIFLGLCDPTLGTPTNTNTLAYLESCGVFSRNALPYQESFPGDTKAVVSR